MSRLQLRRVGKSYGDVPALRELSLDAAQGELLVLVGPSGCGKTTCLRLVAGLETPERGEILIGDREVTALPPAARNVALVFQSYALFHHMTIAQNITFGLAARRTPPAEIDRILAQVAEGLGLSGLLDRRPAQLSGGERQRVALARAMVREPAVFLMDEPLSNLDAQLRVQTRGEIAALQRRLGATMLYVTHDQAEALALGDRIGVLREGLLEQVGTPREVYDRPANAFVARFLGSPPMNLFPAVREGDAVRWAGGRTRAPAAAAGEITVGVRPEHVHLAGSRWSPEPDQDAERFDARVERVEDGGDQAFVTIEAGGVRLVARAEPAFPARPGDSVQAWLSAERLHPFDPVSGARLEER